MNKIIKQHAHNVNASFVKMSVISMLAIVLTACGEVDSEDGEVRNSVNLPTDSVLSLFCPEAGIASEPCILNDPDNPYALTPINDVNKFVFDFGIPSAKARFYLWATAQAITPRGENQYHVGLALQQIYTETGSAIAREQALKAYKSVLDNYFEEVWFYQFPDPPAPGEIFYPQKVRLLSAENLWDPGINGNSGVDPLFANTLLAWEQLGLWGYTYDEDTEDVYRNF